MHVESKKVGRALSAIGSCHLLCLIDHIGECEPVLRCERFHVVEGVLAIGLGVVGHDGDRANANLAQCLGLCYKTADDSPHIWTMVADKNHERALPPAHLCKCVGFSIHASERKVMRLPSERASLHSITSSARSENAGGMLNPSAFAVLRLTTSSNLVGACTGRSAGFAPRRPRST